MCTENSQKFTKMMIKENFDCTEFERESDSIFAIYVEWKFKCPVSLRIHTCAKNVIQSIVIVGKEECMECLQRLGIDVYDMEYFKYWSGVDIYDNDFALFNRKFQMTKEEALDFIKGVKRSVGNAGVKAWAESYDVRWENAKSKKKDKRRMFHAIVKFLRKFTKAETAYYWRG